MKGNASWEKKSKPIGLIENLCQTRELPEGNDISIQSDPRAKRISFDRRRHVTGGVFPALKSFLVK